MSDRYLTENGLARALQGGRNVEQWLGARDESGTIVLRWGGIEHKRDGTATLRVSDVLDDGRDDFIDVYEFSPYDWDAEDGATYPFDTPWSALECAVSKWGARRDRFVNEGLVQHEYIDFRKAKTGKIR